MENTDHGSLNDVVNAQFGEQSSTENLEGAFAEQQAEQAQQVEEPAVEESATEEPKVDVDFSKKFAALSRKEKELRTKESVYEQKMQELQSRINELEASQSKEPAVEQAPEVPLEYRIKKDPLGTLKELGYDYDMLTELVLNDGKLPNDVQMKLMREEIEKDYKSKYEELEKRMIDRDKADEEAKYKQVINNFKSEIDEFIGKDQDTYELINVNKANDLVYDVIEEHYNETGRVLGIQEAANAVENYLEEEAKKFLSLKKFSKQQEAAQENAEPKKPTSPTLSNDHSVESLNQTDKKLSQEESVLNAAKLLRWD